MKSYYFYKYFAYLFIVALVSALGYFIYINDMPNYVVDNNLDTDIREVAQQMVENLDNYQGVGFGLQDLFVTQGESGQEKVKLKANWATFKQDEDIIEASIVEGDYYIANNDNESDSVKVIANNATIYNAEQNAHLYGDVYTEYQGDVIEGNELVYNSSMHSLSFTDGAKLTGKTMNGTSEILTWNLNDNLIIANGNVQITM